MILIVLGLFLLTVAVIVLMSRELERRRIALNIWQARHRELTEDYPDIGILLGNQGVSGCNTAECILYPGEARGPCDCVKDPKTLLYAAHRWRSLFLMAYKPKR